MTRSTGALLINGEPKIKIGGALYLDGIERIVVNQRTGVDYLKITREKNNLLISMRIHDQNSNLIFFMHNNRWWVEHEGDVDYNSSRSNLEIKMNHIDSWLKINIFDNLVKVSCKMYVNGRLVEFTADYMSVGTIIGRFGRIHGDKTSVVIAV